MTAKEKLKQLIDEMHEDQAAVLLMDIEQRAGLSATELAEIARARTELREGRGIEHAEAMGRLRRGA